MNNVKYRKQFTKKMSNKRVLSRILDLDLSEENRKRFHFYVHASVLTERHHLVLVWSTVMSEKGSCNIISYHSKQFSKGIE